MASPLPGIAGADWLVANGKGRVPDERKEELKSVLLRDLEKRFSGATGLQAQALRLEVDQLVETGRISDSNLSRLERRVKERLGGSKTARSESGTVARTERSLLSNAGSLTARQRPLNGEEGSFQLSRRLSAQAAPEPKENDKSTSGGAKSGSLKAVPEDGDFSRWSQVAKLANIKAEEEKVQKKVSVRENQKELREYLQSQVDYKKTQKSHRQVEEQKLFEVQEAELERWKLDQDAKTNAQHRKALEVKKDREGQVAMAAHLREEERVKKLDEDKRLVQRAAKELEVEQKLTQEKKDEAKSMQSALAREWQEGKKSSTDARAIKVKEEHKFAADYTAMLEKQEARNKYVAPKIRSQPTTGPVRAKRRGEELYYDEQIVMKIRNDSIERANEAEKAKKDRLQVAKHDNQEFLFQQIAERDRLRRESLENKGSIKVQAEAATADNIHVEKKKAESTRAKNVEYKHELEKQIQLKKERVKLSEDEMSTNEKAINKRFIDEAKSAIANAALA
eukprot:CAMPEP_0115120174 /NCGR_PEP_ID=MMETSP0227-20121206/45525_1 /TAXON_ID=89957 /ORGANISM="Polarella glacialis, Strain CCMP 1383" /LENGTH=508 /DNA_ID=CAMNT_0002521775 /DNA_START=57 /DNA_END=1583 /DNA_ORIENTATION=+